MSPPLAGVVVVVRGTFALLLLDIFPGRGTVEAMPLAYSLYALVDVGCYENVDNVAPVAQYIVSSTSDEYAVALFSRLAYGITLELVEVLLREIILVEIALAEQWYMVVEQSAEEAFVLIVLLEELLTESAFLGREIEYLLVIEFAVESLRECLGYGTPARAYLPSDIDDNIIHEYSDFYDFCFLTLVINLIMTTAAMSAAMKSLVGSAAHTPLSPRNSGSMPRAGMRMMS